MIKNQTFVGGAGSAALLISIGDTEITVAEGNSRAQYTRSVAESEGATPRLSDKNAQSEARGLVVAGVAAAGVGCDSLKLAGKKSETKEALGLSTPEGFDPALVAKLASTSCAIDVAELPKAAYKAGQVDLDLTLTQTLVDATGLNEFLDGIQGGLPLPDEVTNALDAIQAELESHPAVELAVAPIEGVAEATAAGITTSSPGVAVTLSVLGGIIEIEIGVAATSATVSNPVAKATAEVSFIHVRALNVFSEDPDDAIIDERINAPGDLELFTGTPLETRLLTERASTSESCESAQKDALLEATFVEQVLGGASVSDFDACAAARGDGVSLRLLGDPFPTISVDLVRSQVLAAGNFEQTPIPLAVTGPASAGLLVSGLAIAVAAAVARKRLASH